MKRENINTGKRKKKSVPELETDFSRHLKDSNENVLSPLERDEEWRDGEHPPEPETFLIRQRPPSK